MKIFKISFLFLALICFSNCSNTNIYYENQWPQFRGPYASGILESKNIPVKWDINTGENIKWSIDIPGLGHSSPVIWEDKIFITTAVNTMGEDSLKIGLYGNIENVQDESVLEFRLICINKYTGEILWNKLSHKGVPKTKRHTKASHADPSPATNGQYVVAFFGSEGMYCYDMEGNLKWTRDFGLLNVGYYYAPQIDWSYSGSPIIHYNKVIFQCDYIGDSFLTVLDLTTGDEIWKSTREDVPTWSTPNLYVKGDNKQIVVNGYKHIGGYDFESGEEIWKINGGGDIPVPTPVFGKDLIFIHNAHGKLSPIYAIRPNAKGDISLEVNDTTNDYIAWSIKRGGAYIPTALAYGDYFYNMVGWGGKITCYEANTGKVMYTEKIPDSRGISASGIASNGNLYYSAEQGDVFVVKAGPKFEVIAQNPLNDIIMATPAISEDVIYFRTQHHMIAVEKK